MALEFHEPREQLPEEVIDQHRAVSSLIEELEATIWYQERAAVCKDPELKSLLEHNRDEEIEHASMLLEWLRRNFPGFDGELKTYLFTEAPLLEVEEAAESGEGGDSVPPKPGDSGDLGIGNVRKG